MHVAIVNDGGTNTFYVNGAQHGAPQPTNTIPNFNIFAGCGEGTGGSFHGYLDELRLSTFAPGAFQVSDLLTRPAGPSIINQPQSASVWDGGAMPFTVLAALDSSLTYQWQLNSNNVSGATSATYTAPQVFHDRQRLPVMVRSHRQQHLAHQFPRHPHGGARPKNGQRRFLRAGGHGSAPSLLAYFPVDGDTGTTLTNVKDATHNGTLENGANYDGRTNRAFGVRALAFSGAGDVQVPNNPAFEFSGGNGTIEALVYLGSGSQQPGTILAWAFDGGGAGGIGYALEASADGTQLLHVNGATDTNNNTTSLSWLVPANLIGRQKAYVALLIDHMTNVTAVLDGQSLGT